MQDGCTWGGMSAGSPGVVFSSTISRACDRAASGVAQSRQVGGRGRGGGARTDLEVAVQPQRADTVGYPWDRERRGGIHEPLLLLMLLQLLQLLRLPLPRLAGEGLQRARSCRQLALSEWPKLHPRVLGEGRARGVPSRVQRRAHADALHPQHPRRCGGHQSGHLVGGPASSDNTQCSGNVRCRSCGVCSRGVCQRLRREAVDCLLDPAQDGLDDGGRNGTVSLTMKFFPLCNCCDDD